jgi:hypothetical protein
MALDGKAFGVQHGELAGLVQGEGMAGEGGNTQVSQNDLLMASSLPSSRRGRMVMPCSAKRRSIATKWSQTP